MPERKIPLKAAKAITSIRGLKAAKAITSIRGLKAAKTINVKRKK